VVFQGLKILVSQTCRPNAHLVASAPQGLDCLEAAVFFGLAADCQLLGCCWEHHFERVVRGVYELGTRQDRQLRRTEARKVEDFSYLRVRVLLEGH
jgi:hypothetical protein